MFRILDKSRDLWRRKAGPVMGLDPAEHMHPSLSRKGISKGDAGPVHVRSLEESSSSSQSLVLQLYLYMQQASSDDKPSPALSKDILKSLRVTTLEGEATAITMVRKLAMDPKPSCGIAKVEGQELKAVIVASDGLADLQPLAYGPDWLPAILVATGDNQLGGPFVAPPVAQAQAYRDPDLALRQHAPGELCDQLP